MDKDRKQIKIYQNEINTNNLSNRKPLILNQYKKRIILSDERPDIPNQNNVYKNGIIYKSKKIPGTSNMINNRYKLESKNQKPEKFVNNNNNNINPFN